MAANAEQLRIAQQLVRQLRQMQKIAEDEGLYMPQDGNYVHEVLSGLADSIEDDIINQKPEAA
jgi:hypothetical protein